MKYAKFKGKKTHAREAKSGDTGTDLWYDNYEVKACVGKYRQFWKYIDDKPQLPPGYEPETEWHAGWKAAVMDEYCEVVCGVNREHRADIKTDEYVIEIQKSPIDGHTVVERNAFYNQLTGARVIWIVNVEGPWKSKRISILPKGKEGYLCLHWKNKWKWVEEISATTETHLYLDFNRLNDKLIKMWTYQGDNFCRWVKKLDFFDQYLKPAAVECYRDSGNFLELFK